MPPRPFHTNPEEIVLWVVPASQYSTKVLAGLEGMGLNHYLEFANPVPAKRKLPSGDRFIPELEFKGQGINDSSTIFQFLDDHLGDERLANKFYPTDHPKIDEIRACDKEGEQYLDLFCDYFNYVDETGYKNSVRQSLSTYIPWWAFWINIDSQLKQKRQVSREKCEKGFGHCGMDRGAVEEALFEQLLKYEACLNESGGPFLYTSDAPTAADFCIFSKVCRLTDNLGDVSIGAGYPDLFDKAKDRGDLSKFLTWYEKMQSMCPLKWRGKRL